MSTPTLASQRSPYRSLNWRTLLIAGVIAAIIAGVAVLVLTSSSTTKSPLPARPVQATPPAAVQATPPAAAKATPPAAATHAVGADHPLPHALIESSALSSGMGHR